VTIIQLVPGAPPLVNGVGDYAFAVARELRASTDIDSVFLVCNPDWRVPQRHEGFRLIAQPSRSAKALVCAISDVQAGLSSPCSVLLQLSPYGYDSNGAPFWLLRGLNKWKRSDPKRHRLCTYFHELYASGKPWTRGYWLSPVQRACTRGIARLSDGLMTSMQAYGEALERWRNDVPGSVARLPIASTVGESDVPVADSVREPRIAVFGSVGLRNRAYAQRGGIFWKVCRMLGVREVVDIGDGQPPALKEVAPLQVTRTGVLSAGEIGQILRASRFGYVDYFDGYLAKSSVFAAYCAHGVVSVLPQRNASEVDGLKIGTHYWAPNCDSLDAGRATAIASAARAWYENHNIAAHARLMADQMRTF